MTILTLAALSSAVPPGAAAQTSPPAPGQPRPVQFPKPVDRTLPNGLRVVVAEKPGVPLVSARLIVRSGAEVDPAGLDGLAKLTANLLTKGTESRSAPQIAEAIDALGASLEADARWDASSVGVSGLTSNFGPALDLLADVARRPSFAAEELERLRAQTMDELSIELAEPSTIARYAAARLVFGGGPYGHAVDGLPQTIEKIQRDDVVKIHRAWYRPDNAILVIGGQITADAAFAAAERSFGDWAKPAEPLPQLPAAPAEARRGRVLVVDKSDTGQAAVSMYRPALKRTDPRYFEVLVANAVLGGGYSSRLNQEVRIKRGLSYGAFTLIDARREVGPLVAMVQTKNESAAEVSQLVLAELGRLGKEPIPDAELRPRKASLSGNFARSLETSGGLVSQVGTLALHGIDFGEINAYVGKVEAVTAEQIQAMATEKLGPEGASLIVVGDASKFLEALRKQAAEVEVIPEAELDLASPNLRKAPGSGPPPAASPGPG